MDTVHQFFNEKKPWSKYKDLILSYYLVPYLHKVKTIGRPILVVDCFAGPGKFDDGEFGSPLIISQKLQSLYEQGIEVLGFYIEKDPVLYENLKKNTENLAVPVTVRSGNFREHIDELATLAKTHTVFVYLDPIKPSDLLFNDLESVYTHLQSGQSVETLINFMTTNFLRGIWGVTRNISNQDELETKVPQIQLWDQIAGGTYWRQIAFDPNITQRDRTDSLANGYAKQLQRWFKWVLTYPIREKYEYELPKYHLIFGSRQPDAVDLMNRAMVKARRSFVGAQFTTGMLFDNQPAEEVVDTNKIKQLIVETAKTIGKQTWKLLRVNTTIADPCMYTDSELNNAIKQLIITGVLKSDCAGKKIEENAFVWL